MAAHTTARDAVGLLHHAGAGAVRQFTEWDSLAWVGATALGTVALIATENRWQRSVEDAGILGPGGRRFGDIAGIITSTPLLPLGAYVAGRNLNDERLTMFGLEVTATQGIVLLETLLLSQVPIHQRPRIARGELQEDDETFFNQFFRGASSLPSGHVAGVAVLTFKAWEWYGIEAGLPAAILTAFIGYARVEDGQHYTSDIFSTIALAGIASVATSRTRTLWTEYVNKELVVQPFTSPTTAGLTIHGLW